MRSWERKFEGDRHLRVLHALKAERHRTAQPCARYAYVYQSSGMGKSRLVHEMGQHVLVIPICLRPEDDSGEYCLPMELPHYSHTG